MRDGDIITLDVPARTLTLEVSDEEMARRRAEWKARPRPLTARLSARFFSMKSRKPTKAAISASSTPALPLPNLRFIERSGQSFLLLLP